MTESEQTEVETKPAEPEVTWTEFEPLGSYIVGDIVIIDDHNNGEPSVVINVGLNPQGDPFVDVVDIKLIDGVIVFGKAVGGNIPMATIDCRAGIMRPDVLQRGLDGLH